MDIPPNVKLIFGRKWLNDMQAVPSTRHQCLKFPILDTVMTVEENPPVGDPKYQALFPTAQPVYTYESVERIFDHGPQIMVLDVDLVP